MKRNRAFIGRRHARGFSLIEMVAAFLVFAIAMGVLMQILATSMRNTRQSSDYTMAALWAQSKLDTVGVGVPVEAGTSSGQFDGDYSWELNIQQVDPASVEPPPQQPLAAGNQGAANGNPVNPRTSVANAGTGSGAQVTPFDLYQVDLTVLWGGRFASNRHSARFGTLRAVNPDPGAGVQGVGLNTRPTNKLGGAGR